MPLKSEPTSRVLIWARQLASMAPSKLAPRVLLITIEYRHAVAVAAGPFAAAHAVEQIVATQLVIHLCGCGARIRSPLAPSIIVSGTQVSGSQRLAYYLLYYQGVPLAVIEAKHNSNMLGDGLLTPLAELERPRVASRIGALCNDGKVMICRACAEFCLVLRTSDLS
jgi:hypothetical protein